MTALPLGGYPNAKLESERLGAVPGRDLIMAASASLSDLEDGGRLQVRELY
jgi:hypothetical protein